MYTHVEKNNIIDNKIKFAAPVFPGLLWCTCDVGTEDKYNIRIYYTNVHTCNICGIEEYVNTRIILALNCKLHAIQITAHCFNAHTYRPTQALPGILIL